MKDTTKQLEYRSQKKDRERTYCHKLELEEVIYTFGTREVTLRGLAGTL